MGWVPPPLQTREAQGCAPGTGELDFDFFISTGTLAGWQSYSDRFILILESERVIRDDCEIEPDVFCIPLHYIYMH